MAATVYLNEMALVCALGIGETTVRDALFVNGESGVVPDATLIAGKSLHLGAVREALLPCDMLPPASRSRNNALVLTALQQIRTAVDAAIARYGGDRVAVVLGTSTSGMREWERAVAHLGSYDHLPCEFDVAQTEMGSPALMLGALLGVSGPCFTVSTACSSSAKSLISAARLLQTGRVDAVISGGMDALCAFTVAGFMALQAVSAARCNPLSANRCGINIGEGGALFLMTREPGAVRLAGWGECSDAHHISAPAPDGRGALTAMQQALAGAGLQPGDIDYMNLHGTATVQNDAMEALAVYKLFGAQVPVSSTKPLTGHALGGAGALEAALCWLTLKDNSHGRLPAHRWDGERDAALPALQIVDAAGTLGRSPVYAMSNSFAFGGSNATLILGKG